MIKRNPKRTETQNLKNLTSRWARFLPATCLLLALETAHAQTSLFWNPQNTVGPSDGNGNWDDAVAHNWLSNGIAVSWPAGGTNAVIGAGVPGTYNITNQNTVTAWTITFSNAANYTLYGAQLTVNNSVQRSLAIASLPNTTNTIACLVSSSSSVDITNAPNSQLTLSGGGSFNNGTQTVGVNQNNSSVWVNGGGTYSFFGTFEQKGVTLNVTNAIINNNGRIDVAANLTGVGATVNVYNGGQFNANATGGNNSGNHLQISRSGGDGTLNVYPGGLVTSRVWSGITVPNDGSHGGNIRIFPTDSNGQGTLNVLGGTVLAGDGANINGTAGSYSAGLSMITFYDSPPTVVSQTNIAMLNMTAGSVTANSIALSQPNGLATYNPFNGFNISGGALYLGAPNISYPVSGMGTNFQFNLSGGVISAIQNWSPACSAPVNLTNVNGNITFQAADINGTAYNLGFSGPITGIGGLFKTGGGILTLSGADNFSGLTVVSNGTLTVSTLNVPKTGGVTIEGAAVATGLPVNSTVIASSGQSWTVNGALTYDSGTPTADFNYGNFPPSTTVPAIQVNGNLAFNVTPLMTVEGNAIPVGKYPLITYTGTLSGTPPSSVTLSNIYSGYITNITATKTIALVVTNSPVVNGLVWAVGNGYWNFAALNWFAPGGGLTSYADPQPVVFNDTASGPYPILVTVSNNLTVQPSSINVTSTNNYTIAGPGVIGGSASVVKSGTGTLTLSGTNTYSGGTTVDTGGGTLNINYGGDGVANSAIGTGPLTLNTGAKLGNASGGPLTLLTPITEYWNDDWTFVGTNDLNLGNAPVILGNGQVVLTVVTNTVTVNGQITDNGLTYGIQKQGGGTLTLNNNNPFSGTMDVEAGLVNVNANGALGTGTLILGGPGATLDNTSGSAVSLSTAPALGTLKGLTFLGTTNLDLGTVSWQIQGSPVILNVSNNMLSVEGDLGGSSSILAKDGPGALLIGGSGISGSVTFNVNEGTVYLDRTTGSQAINDQGANINTNAAVVIINPTGTQLHTSAITWNGGLLELNGDTGESIASPSTFNSGILRNSGGPVVFNIRGGSTLILAGTADFDVTNGSSLTLNGNVGGTVTNAVLLKTGAGTLIVATNTYAGNTTVSNGVLSLILPTLSTNSTVTIAAGATLDLNFTNSVATTNIIAALVINGVSQPLGIYNSNNVPSITSGGTLYVVPPPTINPNSGTIQVSVSGANLNLAWPTNAGWLLQVQTNSLQSGLGTNWVTVSGSGSVTNLSVPMNPVNGATFYRMVHP